MVSLTAESITDIRRLTGSEITLLSLRDLEEIIRNGFDTSVHITHIQGTCINMQAPPLPVIITQCSLRHCHAPRFKPQNLLAVPSEPMVVDMQIIGYDAGFRRRAEHHEGRPAMPH